jgi:hypothetical protein
MYRVFMLLVGLALAVASVPGVAGATQQGSTRPSRSAIDGAEATLRAQSAMRQSTAKLEAVLARGPAGTGQDVRTNEACYGDVREDAAGDVATLDAVAFGALYHCDVGVWQVAVATDDAWTGASLDFLEFYFDTDLNDATGCFGDESSVFGFWDATEGWLAGVWSTPSCDPETWQLVAGAAIAHFPADNELDMAFAETDIGSPDAMYYYAFLKALNSVSYDDVGDGYKFLLSDYHGATVGGTAGLTATGTFTRSKIALGSSSTMRGSLSPAYEGAVVRLQKLTGGGWDTVASKTLAAGVSSYSFRVTPGSSANHEFRVYAPGDAGHTADASPRRTLTVYDSRITSIVYNPPGRDARNLNGEYVVVKNTGNVGINLKGWTIDAGNGRTRTLPDYALAKGSTVRLHTGSGPTTSGHIYLGFGSPLWGDQSGTGKLFDRNGTLLSTYRY